MKTSSKMVLGLLTLAGLLLFPPNGSSCGPFFTEAVFVYESHPGQPLKWYAEGDLGVVFPGYSRAYLVVAYRYLAGNPLSAQEQRGALDFWGWALKPEWRPQERTDKDPVDDWLSARSRIMGKAAARPSIVTDRSVGFEDYGNCLDDSFRTAVLTLGDRSRRYGTGSPAVLEWIKGQDVVFSNCAEANKIPAMVGDASPAWLKADRRYQIAAAYFYAQSFERAAQEFDQIAADAGSPWHSLAPYLAARAVIRSAMLATTDRQKADGLERAEKRLRQIVKDPKQRSMHHAARQMLGFVTFRTHPQERNVELARLLAGPRPDPDFRQDLIDYAWSMDQFVGEGPFEFSVPHFGANHEREEIQWRQQTYRKLASVRAAQEMTDWIFTFQYDQDGGRIHALERWRQRHSLPWLVAALSKIDAGDPAAPELVRAAEEVPAGSPAYPTVAYHRVRLLLKSGENEKARALLDDLLSPHGPKLTVSSRNVFLAQRLVLSTSFEDFLARAPRPVAELSYDWDDGPACNSKACKDFIYGTGVSKETLLRFDRDSAFTLNLRLPLDMLAHAVAGDELPEPLRGELAVATWTRAVMLDRHDVAVALIPEIEKAYPVTKELLESYAAAGPDEKDQTALFVMLHFPGMRPFVNFGVARETRMDKIDNYRDNWWCADVGADVETVNYEKNFYDRSQRKAAIPENAPPYPAFLSAEQVKTAGEEWKRLAASGSGDSYLPKKTLEWASDHPHDPRLAEALHFAVRTTRYGCGVDKHIGVLSHKAFTVLHERYPNSKWAKATPYWF
jgi:hypothetical protein